MIVLWAVALKLGEQWFSSFKEKGICIEKSVDVLSPDSKWLATIETVDNGLGFGLGRVYNEVHIRTPGNPITDHGDADLSTVFYVESEQTPKDFPVVQWLNPRCLRIEYPNLHKPGKALVQINGITVEYRTRRAA